MHQTNMFANRGMAQNNPVSIEPYDLQMLAPTFQGWNFNTGTAFDQHTPQIALRTVQEIQNSAQKGHPIRVGMFNYMTDNNSAFNNAAFQDLVQVIVLRLIHGVNHSEWGNINVGLSDVITRAVKCCGCALASEDEEFLSKLPAADQKAVRENAQVWEYLVALASGNAAYIPFSQMDSAAVNLNGTDNATQNAMAVARNLGNTNSSAFSEGYTGVSNSQYNNNATGQGGRYARRAEKMYGKLQGSMQEALGDALTAQTTAPYQSRFSRGNGVAQEVKANPELAKAAAQFDSDVTDFTRSMDTTTTVAAKAPEPEPTKTLFSVQIGGEVVEIVRHRPKDGRAVWKSSRLQRFHPAWCVRTHACHYVETKDGTVIAVLQELTNPQKEIAMNYEAHAIDPTKGQPADSVPVKPVKEEAKVLYNKAESVKINLVTSKAFKLVDDTASAIRAIRLAAEMSEEVPQAYAGMAIVATPIVYATAEDAEEDLTVLRAISGSKNFAEAASYVPKISNDMARKFVNRTMTKAVNRAIECEMGIGITIENFAEDGVEIVAALEKHYGALPAEKLRNVESFVLRSNVFAVPATDESIKEHANSTLTAEGETELPEAMAKRILFLNQNVCVTWVNYTDDELAIGMGPKGATIIQPESLGAVHEISNTVYKDVIENRLCAEQFMVTKDSVSYNVHRGLLNKDCYLLSNKIN